MKIFLGGTCNDTQWRENLIPMLEIEYFNPVVEDWTPEDMKEEVKQRKLCDYCLYVITPEMTGVYSIAEVVDDSNKQPKKTLFCFIDSVDGDLKFDEGQTKSLQQVAEMIDTNGGRNFSDLGEIARYVNLKKIM